MTPRHRAMRAHLISGFLISTFILAATGPSAAFAANVTVPDAGLNIVLPSDGSVYSVSSGGTFDQLDVSGGTFTFTMTAGESVTVTAPDNRDLVNNGGFNYICGSKTTLTISATGSIVVVVTPTSGGNTLCRYNGGAGPNPIITFVKPILTTITISPLTAIAIIGKTTQQLTATMLDQQKNPITAALTWKSSNTAVATVSTAGLVTPVAVGSANITASSGGIISASVVITVVKPTPATTNNTTMPVATITTPTTTPKTTPKTTTTVRTPASTPASAAKTTTPATTPSSTSATTSKTTTTVRTPASTPAATSATPATSPSASSGASVQSVFQRTLSFGMSGSDVLRLQKLLAQYQTIYPQDDLTGYFGSSTKQAVIRFQLKYNLSPIGIVGPQTRDILNKMVAR